MSVHSELGRGATFKVYLPAKIASTGRGGQGQGFAELKELEVHACLTKPYNKTKLLMTLHDALHSQPNKS